MRLEICDTSNSEVYVISPSCNDGIWLQTSMSLFLIKIKKCFSHLFFECAASLLVSRYDGGSDEGVRIEVRVSACFSLRVPGPEARASYFANCESKSGFLPERYVDLAECHDKCVPSIALQSVA